MIDPYDCVDDVIELKSGQKVLIIGRGGGSISREMIKAILETGIMPMIEERHMEVPVIEKSEFPSLLCPLYPDQYKAKEFKGFLPPVNTGNRFDRRRNKKK